MHPKSRFCSLGIFLICLFSWCSIAETFRVATYNVENYLDEPTQTRVAKSAESKARVRDCILALKPDVIALQEIGSPGALQELRASLKSAGLDLPYWEHVAGADTNVHVAILSKFPFTARRPPTNDNFLLGGPRFPASPPLLPLPLQLTPQLSLPP